MAEMSDREMLSAILTNIQTMSAKITAIQDEQTHMRQDINRIETNMNRIETNMNRIETNMNRIETNMNRIETNMNRIETTMITGFQTVNDKLDDLSHRTSKLESDMYRIRKV
ncbi:hypothetical protein [Paenibacillus cymbidii]|uniref:hypothetical protein n=1 Tax=Paenibacillus cymbidii TaxID=1639034 RepID=UPI0010807C1B|nr:hypothetical protein [Paenibacillus cymbidii]